MITAAAAAAAAGAAVTANSNMRNDSIQGSQSLNDKKSRLSRTPTKNFPGPFWSTQMFKYKEKTAFTRNIQSVVYCGNFSMKQNVCVSCSEFR